MTSSDPTTESAEETGGKSRSGGRWLTAVVGGLVILLVIARVGFSGSEALSRGDAAREAGDHLGAAASWREAISWVLPMGASWRGEAMDRLEALADEREAAGDLSGAVMALSSLRSGILAGHGLWRPNGDRITITDGRLAPLLASWEAQDAHETGRSISGDRASRVAYFQGHLSREVRPSRSMSVLALVGFLSWIIGAYRAAGAQGRHRWRELGLAILGFIAMLVGVAWA